MKMPKVYELFMHNKQGDDFNGCLQKHVNDLPAALREWGESFNRSSSICMQLAKAFTSQEMDIQADSHMVVFEPKTDAARAVLDAMVAEGLIFAVAWE
jgi:hypothetical protein